MIKRKNVSLKMDVEMMKLGKHGKNRKLGKYGECSKQGSQEKRVLRRGFLLFWLIF